MSARVFSAGWDRRLTPYGSDHVLPDWKSELNEVWNLQFSRPLSRLLRQNADGTCRVYEGWRAEEIAATVDALVDARRVSL